MGARIVACSAAVLALAACAPGPVDYGLPSSVGERSLAGLIVPVTCYRTLAEVTCEPLFVVEPESYPADEPLQRDP